jgi:putative flippase GtrA
MSDAVTAVVGIVLMTAFLALIALKLGEVPVWIAFIVGIALMFWGFWTDAFLPLFRRRPDNGS